jgi:hypothetical protein
MKKITPYLIPSIADLFFVILLVVLSFNLGQFLLGDCDTGYHVRAGEYILETLSIPRMDMFSFLDPPPAWTAHEWLSEIIMALAHDALGLTGIVIFFAFILSTTYYLHFKFLQKESNHILLLTGMALLVIASSVIHFLARPHLFSLLFVVIWYFVLDSYQYRNRNYLYFLPLLMVIWVNLHGAFIIGFVLLGTYFIGNIIYYFFNKDVKKDTHTSKAKAFFVVGIVCLAASLINPYGYHILLFPFDFVTNQYILAHVREFQAANFQDFHVYKYLFLIMLAVLMTSRLRLNLIELILVLGFTCMSLYSARNIPMFTIILAPILIRRLDDMTRQSNNRLISFLNNRSSNFMETERKTKGFLWPALALCLVIFVAAAGGVKHSFDPEVKPVAAVEFLKNEHITGNMFNDDEIGDYIIYAAYPQYRVFFDGRNDMYGLEHMQDYLRVLRLGYEWQDVLEKYDIQWIFFNADSLLSRYLLEREDWHLIYADQVAHIYVRDIPEYEYLIEKYPDVEPVDYEEKKS